MCLYPKSYNINTQFSYSSVIVMFISSYPWVKYFHITCVFLPLERLISGTTGTLDRLISGTTALTRSTITRFCKTGTITQFLVLSAVPGTAACVEVYKPVQMKTSLLQNVTECSNKVVLRCPTSCRTHSGYFGTM